MGSLCVHEGYVHYDCCREGSMCVCVPLCPHLHPCPRPFLWGVAPAPHTSLCATQRVSCAFLMQESP